MRAGAAKTVITPPLPIQLAGHKGKRIAIGIAEDLHARAVVCQDADRKIALVSADLLWLGREHVQRIRNVVEERADIPARNVFIACTHTHSGPDTLDFPDNVTTRRGTIVVCEDGGNDNYVRALRPDGELVNIAWNQLYTDPDDDPSTPPVDRTDDEFAGSTFSPDGKTLFVNVQASKGLSFAIWGPWQTLGM